MEQQENKLNLALLSPNEDAYSETFIQAHKRKINKNIFYYYGGLVPCFLEGYGALRDDNLSENILKKIVRCFRKNINSSSALNNLKHSFISNNIEVVLAEFGVTAAESLPAIRGAGVPLVVHFHGFDAHNKDIITKYKEQYKELFAYAKKIVVVSQFMKKQLISLGCPEEKIVYTVCAPNEEYYEVIPSFKTQQFLAVGRFVDKKAPYYTILAFKGVVGKYPEARLVMAADGPLLATCKNLAKYLGIKKNIDFIGVVDRDRIKKEMSKSLAFVQHSIVAENGDSEGTPVAVMESGAAGLPVVATRHAGIKDVVIEGETGLLVDEHDVCAMTMAMNRLIGDTDFAKKLGKNARKSIKNNFSMEKHIALLEGLCKSFARKQKKYHKEEFLFKGLEKWTGKMKFAIFAPHKFVKKYSHLVKNILNRKRCNLVMTVLARDEGDIIRENIEFHLSKGVDFIIATDNASVDNTRDIFLEYQKKGKLFLIDEPGRDKSQALWNNRMTRMAIEKYKADIIFHCDADEFWRPKSGNLKNEMLSISADILKVDLINVLLENKNGEEKFPRDAKYAMVAPVETDDFKEDSKGKNLYIFRYPPKVMLNTRNGLLEVAQGNHSIVGSAKSITNKTSTDIDIFHFPLRGKKRFYNKVAETGKAVEKNKLLTKGQSWHIRRWYESYKDGKLDQEYQKLTILKEDAEKMEKRGLVERFDFNEFIKK